MSGVSDLDSKLARAILFGVAGGIVGMATGVAAFGAAVSGAIVFGPIAFVVGWLLPSAKSIPHAEVATDPIEHVKPPNASRTDFQHVENSANEIIPLVVRGLGAVWNMQMRIAVAIGIMPFLQQFPWILFFVAFFSLGVFFPIGIVFCVTGMAAMHLSARPENQFIVNLDAK